MSEKSVYKVRKDRHVIIPAISDDFAVVKKDINRKVSKLTLRYLKDKKLITGLQYQVYKLAISEPNERFSMTENAVVKYVNEKFIKHYESL